jgi:hypothetical protein
MDDRLFFFSLPSERTKKKKIAYSCSNVQSRHEKLNSLSRLLFEQHPITSLYGIFLGTKALKNKFFKAVPLVEDPIE